MPLAAICAFVIPMRAPASAIATNTCHLRRESVCAARSSRSGTDSARISFYWRNRFKEAKPAARALARKLRY